jgi:hypothetical protein
LEFFIFFTSLLAFSLGLCRDIRYIECIAGGLSQRISQSNQLVDVKNEILKNNFYCMVVTERPKPNPAPDSKGGGRVFATFAWFALFAFARIRSKETDKGREEISQTKTDRAAYLITRQPGPQQSSFPFPFPSLVFSFLSTLNVFAAAIELVRKLNLDLAPNTR